jgi:hypothetical protein
MVDPHIALRVIQEEGLPPRELSRQPVSQIHETPVTWQIPHTWGISEASEFELHLYLDGDADKPCHRAFMGHMAVIPGNHLTFSISPHWVAAGVEGAIFHRVMESSTPRTDS